MAIAKFTKVESLFRTTLAAGITSTQTTITLSAAPGALTEFPQWFVIEPLSSNYEIIYVPQDDGSATLTNVVRGINPNEDTDVLSANFCKAHPANVDVILAPMHRHWNELSSVMDGVKSTGGNIFRIGDETAANITIYAQNADATKPFFQYDETTSKWLISNDGVSTYDITSGGSGLTRGPGVNIVASAITLDVRTSGGLRNNQGTGSAQADVDPTIVARLDTANTFTAVQTLTADRLQITTDADTDNDAVRKLYLDEREFGNGSDGALNVTSGTTTLMSNRPFQYTSINVSAGATLTIGGSAARNPLTLLCQGDVTIDGTLDLSGQGLAGVVGTSNAPGTVGATGRAVAGAGGSGGGGEASTGVVAGGDGGAATGASGGAAGTGAAGADGGAGASVTTVFSSVFSIVNICRTGIRPWGLGAGGASGGGGNVGGAFAGATGGDGGGSLNLRARGNVSIGATGTIKCNGLPGGDSVNNGFAGGNSGGGGGGGGGLCVITHGGTFTNAGSIDITGGAGGSNAAGVAPLAGNGGAGANGISSQIQL